MTCAPTSPPGGLDILLAALVGLDHLIWKGGGLRCPRGEAPAGNGRGADRHVVAAAAYYRVGWWRMEQHCSTDPVLQGRAGVSFDWQWQPPGFTCTFRDGEVERSLWF